MVELRANRTCETWISVCLNVHLFIHTCVVMYVIDAAVM